MPRFLLDVLPGAFFARISPACIEAHPRVFKGNPLAVEQ